LVFCGELDPGSKAKSLSTLRHAHVYFSHYGESNFTSPLGLDDPFQSELAAPRFISDKDNVEVRSTCHAQARKTKCSTYL
jgi:hypothetical protein